MTAKGLSFTRLAIAMALGKDGLDQAVNIAKARWGEDCFPARIIDKGGPAALLQQKAAMPSGATASGAWGAELTALESASAEFFALVREASLLGRIPGLRRVPLQTKLISAVTGVTAAWIGEGTAVPVSKATYDADNMAPRKVGALAVITEELARSSDPSAEIIIRDDMVRALALAVDETFIDPANEGDEGVKPASITYGAPSAAASGDGPADIREMIAGFPGDLSRAILIGSPARFAVLSDPFLLPGLGVRGGSALGIPAIASNAAGSTLALVDPGGIAVGEGDMDLKTTRQASIEMETEPEQDATEPTGAGANMVSLWQANAVGIMAIMVANWEVARPSVQVVTSVAAS